MLQEEVVENASAKRCRDVIVCGFYTPDYAEIAANLAKSLDLHSIPYKLYPVEKFGKAWIAQPLRKPEIILRCMEEFPHRVVIFMDADCTVHADISPLIEEVVDVGVYFLRHRVGQKRGRFSLLAASLCVGQPRGLNYSWKTGAGNARKLSRSYSQSTARRGSYGRGDLQRTMMKSYY